MYWENPSYIFHGSGTIDLDQNLNYTAKFILKKNISNNLVGNSDARKELVNSKGQIVIPLKITGKLDSPDVKPDHGAVGKMIGKAISRAVAAKASRATENKINESIMKKKKPTTPSIKKSGKDLLRKLF